MEKIYSNIYPSKLLHIIVRKEDIAPGRTDIITPENFLQCAMLNMEAGTTFRPHKHIWKSREESVIAQESWICILGKVKCILYDLDDTVIAEPILSAGDASFTLEGGHNYEVIEQAIVLEYKTGPYSGQVNDKRFIE
jgi:hypothetical protein